MSQTYADNVATAAYVENYLDFVENLPQEIQRFITRFHEIEISYMALINDIASHREILEKEEGDLPTRRRTLLRMEKTLIRIQELGDEKVEIGQQINDFIDYKYRSLDHDLRNLDLFKDSESSDALKDTAKDASINQNSTAVGGGGSSGPVNSSNSTLGGSAGLGGSSVDKQNGTNGGSSGGGGGNSASAGVGGGGGSGGGSGGNERGSKRARRTRAEQDIESSPIETRGSVGLNNSGSSNKQSTGTTGGVKGSGSGAAAKKKKRKCRQREESPPREEELPLHEIDEPTYCLCDQISYGEMILCDNDLCPIEWFHFVCVSLTTKPKGKWFCPKCRGDRPNIMKPKSQFLKELERYNKEKEEKA